MKLFDLLKAAKDVLVGSESYEIEGDSPQKYEDIDLEENLEDFDGDDEDELDDDDDEGLTEAEISTFESALRGFYSRLSEKEMNDPDLDKMTEEIQNRFFEHKIKDPEKALDDVYSKWKSTLKERNHKRRDARATIIEMLRSYATLTQEEKERLTDYDSPFYLGKLKKADSKAIAEIVQSWFDNKLIDEERYNVIDAISMSEAESWWPYIDINKILLTEDDYNQLLVIYRHDDNRGGMDHKEMADYIKRYWMQSESGPQQVETDNLIVNRPCYMIAELKLCTPHFHLGKRYFDEEDCYQNVKVYLFADKLEYICDGGHVEIELSEIIDISFNDWGQIAYRWQNINHWREVEKGYYGNATNTEPCPESPEPELLEITCRNDRKILFTHIGDNTELLILRAFLFYFIKKAR